MSFNQEDSNNNQNNQTPATATLNQLNYNSYNQHLKYVRLAIEYKQLMNLAPPGVYVIPELENIHVLHGVIFIRRGYYRNGVFRFRIDLPPNYNDKNTYPLVTFTPPIYNPLVDASTGILSIKSDIQFAEEWDPQRHFLVSVLIFIKQAFFMKSFDGYLNIPNQEALQMFNNDKEEYLKLAQTAVQESIMRIHDNQSYNNTLIFTEPKPAHEEFIRNVLLRQEAHQSQTMEDADDPSDSQQDTSTDQKNTNQSFLSRPQDDSNIFLSDFTSTVTSTLDISMGETPIKQSNKTNNGEAI